MVIAVSSERSLRASKSALAGVTDDAASSVKAAPARRRADADMRNPPWKCPPRCGCGVRTGGYRAPVRVVPPTGAVSGEGGSGSPQKNAAKYGPSRLFELVLDFVDAGLHADRVDAGRAREPDPA